MGNRKALLDAAGDLRTIAEHVNEGVHLASSSRRIEAWAEMLEAIGRGAEVNDLTAFLLEQGVVEGYQHDYELEDNQ